MRKALVTAFRLIAGLLLAGGTTGAAGQQVRALRWSGASVDSLPFPIQRALYTAPIYDPFSWGYRLAVDTLGGRELVFVQGTVAGGTGAHFEAFFVYWVSGHLPPSLVWTGRAAESVLGEHGDPGYRLTGCLGIVDDTLLAYVATAVPSLAVARRESRRPLTAQGLYALLPEASGQPPRDFHLVRGRPPPSALHCPSP